MSDIDEIRRRDADAYSGNTGASVTQAQADRHALLELLHQTEDKCMALRAEVEALRKDAERYRRIRDPWFLAENFDWCADSESFDDYVDAEPEEPK